MPRKNLELTPEAIAVLDDEAPDRGRGDFVSRTIVEAHRALVGAIHYARACGWRPGEMAAVCDALKSTWADLPLSGLDLAVELEDAARFEGLVAKWEIDGDEWRPRVAALAKDIRLAGALWIFSRAYWSGSDLARRVIAG